MKLAITNQQQNIRMSQSYVLYFKHTVVVT